MIIWVSLESNSLPLPTTHIDTFVITEKLKQDETGKESFLPPSLHFAVEYFLPLTDEFLSHHLSSSHTLTRERAKKKQEKGKRESL